MRNSVSMFEYWDSALSDVHDPEACPLIDRNWPRPPAALPTCSPSGPDVAVLDRKSEWCLADTRSGRAGGGLSQSGTGTGRARDRTHADGVQPRAGR